MTQSPHRCDVWWARLGTPDKARPVVLVSREDAYRVRAHITVAPVTSRLRPIRTHVAIGHAEGLSKPSAVNCGLLLTIPREELIERVGALGETKARELDEALRFALGLE